jgi:hypothetical protein
MLDYGLWNIAGKLFGKPMDTLLGATREKILAYGSTIHHTSDERFVETALRCKEAGFEAVRLHPYCTFEDDIRLVYKVRRAVGAALAEANNMKMEPHDFGGGTASLHAGLAITNCDYAPTGPGLGFPIDLKAAEKVASEAL